MEYKGGHLEAARAAGTSRMVAALSQERDGKRTRTIRDGPLGAEPGPAATSLSQEEPQPLRLRQQM